MSIKNVHGTTLDLLGEQVVAGRYAPGSTMPPEAALCEEMGVSRTVVREVVKSLAAKGLVVTGPKLGTRVLDSDQWNWLDADVVTWQSRTGLTREFLLELQELRRVIEPAGVRLAAERATAQDIAELEQAFAGMQDAVENGGDYVRHDLRFHQGLLRACHNRMLVQMSKALAPLLRASFVISTARPDCTLASLPLHRAVLDAVVARSPAKAEKAVLVLIDGAQGDIEHVLASRRRLPSVSGPPAPMKGRSATARRAAAMNGAKPKGGIPTNTRPSLK